MRRAAAALVVVALAAPARAQHVVDFSVERYTPSALPGPYFQVAGTAVLPRRGLTLGVASSWSLRPLVLRDSKADAELSTPVYQRLGVDVLAGWGLTRSLSLGLAVPLIAQTGDRVAGIEVNDERDLATFAAGDPRLELKALVGRATGFRPRGAFALVVSLPVGQQGEFAGEAGVTIEPRVMVDLERPRWALALNAGARLRTAESQFFDEPIRNELWLGAGARLAAAAIGLGAGRTNAPDGGASGGAGLGRRIWLTGEVTAVIASEGGPTPLELRGGVRIAWAHRLDVGIGIGAGLNREVGAPGFRALLDVRWGGAPRDSDRDGSGDVCDPCVFEAEDADGFQDGDGCPDRDNDGDELPDSEDQCPNQREDMDGNRDLDGCPDPDDDGDLILDRADQCPNQAEDIDGWQDSDGCPDNDNDADGIADSLDGCPNMAEPAGDNGDGCP